MSKERLLIFDTTLSIGGSEQRAAASGALLTTECLPRPDGSLDSRGGGG